ncbi:MAG TPA: hypothetical protein VGE90_13855 [Chitinophaga sp.]
MRTNSPSYLRHHNPENNTQEQKPFFNKSGAGDVPEQQAGFFSAPAPVIQRAPLPGAAAEEEPDFTPAAGPAGNPLVSLPPAKPKEPLASFAPQQQEPLVSLPPEQQGPLASFQEPPSLLDLTMEKVSLITHLADITWINDCFVGLDQDAHPIHKTEMENALKTTVAGHVSQLTALGGRIIGAASMEELNALKIEIDTFKAIHGVLLTKELQDVVELFRLKEQMWVIMFTNNGMITKDPVNANKAGNKALLEYHQGFTGTVKMITRVNYTWNRSAAAVTAGIADWTDAEKTQFKTAFQQQLNNVWDTRKASAYTPFRVSQPSDYLLKNSPLKWSDITAHMQGEVRDAAAAGTPDFTITVIKNDPATEASVRSAVNDGTAKFYIGAASQGIDAAGAPLPTGEQQTLAHEWAHMIGQPDEYPENSADQSQSWISGGRTGTTDNSLGSDQWQACQNELTRRSNDATLTPQQRAQATTDLNNLQNSPNDADAATPGWQDPIHGVANRADNTLALPDGCFAVRGAWTGSRAVRLRPGGRSERGGTHISASAEDAARLTDRGNQVHAYHREGVLQELNSALSTQTNPPVQFEHNFKDMTQKERLETIEAKLNNLHWDLLDIREKLHAPASPQAPESAPEGGQPDKP